MTISTIKRRLKVLGYAARKSRRPESIDNMGGFMVVDLALNSCAAGERYDMTLEDLAAFIKDHGQ